MLSDEAARVQVAEAAADDHKTLLCIVKVALGLLRDEHRFVKGAALCVLKHAVEYGDDGLTASVRKGLHCVDAGEAIELVDSPPLTPGQDAGVAGGRGGDGSGEGGGEKLERVGLDRLLDFEHELVEASKKKGGIVDVLERELTEKENTLEAARQLTDRGKHVMQSELLTEAARQAIMQKPARVPSPEELKEDARIVKLENPQFGVRRIWNCIKQRHPDWTVPEGRVHKLMAAMRAEQQAKDRDALQVRPVRERVRETQGWGQGLRSCSQVWGALTWCTNAGVLQASASAFHALGGGTGGEAGKGELEESEDEAYDSKEAIYDIFKDELFEHFANGSIFLNETEVPKRAHVMSRHAELLYRRSQLADERGLAPRDVSMSEVSEMEREEEEEERLRAAELHEGIKMQEEEDFRERQKESRQRDLALVEASRSHSEGDESVGVTW